MPTLPPLLGQPDIEGSVVLGVGGPRGGERVSEGFLGGFCWCGVLVSVGRVDVGTEMEWKCQVSYYHILLIITIRLTLYEIKVTNRISSAMS